jgi:hypothetical protein
VSLIYLMDMDSETEKSNDYQWWRISFSAEDGKARQAEKQSVAHNLAILCGCSVALGFLFFGLSGFSIFRRKAEHVTYVLSNPKTTAPGHLMDMDSETEKSNDYQWWRI